MFLFVIEAINRNFENDYVNWFGSFNCLKHFDRVFAERIINKKQKHKNVRMPCYFLSKYSMIKKISTIEF